MIEFPETRITRLAIHNVGNKHKGENIFVSEGLTEVDESLNDTLITYFLKPFVKVTETFHFVHALEMSYNEMNGVSEKIFDDRDSFFLSSIQVLKHLYDQSNHVNIKSGDVFVAMFNEVIFYGEPMSAIGIFKAENKDSFLRTVPGIVQIDLEKEEGINVKKLDKGCLILNTEAEDGFRVLSVDNNNVDTEYWQKGFLSIDYAHDDNFETKSVLELCTSFSNDVIREHESKKEQMDFLNETVKYFDDNETVNFDEFAASLFTDDHSRNQFKQYKNAYEEDNNLEIADNIEVSKPVLRKQKRVIKNFIKLDTHIQIKLDFNNPEASKSFIEQGYDNEKKMKFYKIYYNEELN